MLAAVLIVSVSLFILASTMLFFMVSSYSQRQREQNRRTAQYLAESALNRFQANERGIDFHTQDYVLIAPNGGTYGYQMFPWGPQILVKASGAVANQTVELWAVAGSTPSPLYKAAMIVADTRFPIVAAGDTRIIGDIYSGALGLQAGQIRGEAPVREDFHRGQVHIRQSIPLPSIGSECLGRYVESTRRRKEIAGVHLAGTALIRREDQSVFSQDSIFHIENNLRLEDVELSAKSRISIFVGGRAEIAGSTSISGPVEIVADGPVYLSNEALLDGGLLYSADSVVLGDNSTLLGTVVSRTAIHVRDSAKAFYPALLYAEGDHTTNADSVVIEIRTRTLFQATLAAAVGERLTDTLGCVIYVDTNATVRGLLISQDRVDLRGTLLGTVYTNQFRFRLPPTTYINWLKDARIYRDRLDFYPALPFSTDSSQITIARILTP